MLPTVAWTLFTGLGFWFMRNRKRGGPKTQAVLIRLAALLFLVAGTITAGGLIGQALTWLVQVTGQVGAGLAWVLWIVGALSWLAGMVPERIFRGDVPDWLSLCGLAFPSLLASVPGPVGEGIRTALQAISEAIGGGIGAGFSVNA